MLSPDSDADRVALHRYAVIAEALPERLSRAERGAMVRVIAMRTHGHPDGSERRYSRGTVDRWVRDYRRSGLAGLTPQTRSDSGKIRAHPELADVVGALRIELPTRSSVQIADMVWHRFNVRIAPRTVREQLRRQGLHRGALLADPKVFGRFEAEAPNKRWITDVLVGPYVPYPKTDTSVRARLFLIVDDHSRLLVHGRFHAFENTRAGQEVFRQGILRHGLPEVFYCDNGAPFANAALARTCAILGVRLVHSKPYAPQGRGKQERLNRYIRDRFLNEATHQGIESLEQLNDLFEAWTTQVCNIRVHSETNERPIDRFQAGPPVRHPDPARLVDAFRWAASRKVTKTPTISMEGNNYVVDPALVGRRIEVRFDPENLALLDVYFQGKPAGIATPFKIGRHVAKTVPQAARPAPEATGIDYLGAVHAAHEQDTIGTIHYRDMPLINIPLPYFQDDDNDKDGDGDSVVDNNNSAVANSDNNDFGGRS